MKRHPLSTSSTSNRSNSISSSSSFPRRSAGKAAKMPKKRRTAVSTVVSDLGSRRKSPLRPVREDGAVDGVVDHATECQRLRERLERVLSDHQRQEEEIVVLRALARSLKGEVENIQQRQQLEEERVSLDGTLQPRRSDRFFELDVEVEQLRGENDELRRHVLTLQQEAKRTRASVEEHILEYKLAAVKAHAELCGVKSQLKQERLQSDALRVQLARYKARQRDVVVRAVSERTNNQSKADSPCGSTDLEEAEEIKRLWLRHECEDFMRQHLQQNAMWKPSQSQPGEYETLETEKSVSLSSSECRVPSFTSATWPCPSNTSLPAALSTLSLPDEMTLRDELHELSSELEPLSVSQSKRPGSREAGSVEM